MKNIISIFSRELTGYFETPVAYVFMVVFLIASGAFTFYMGGFYQVGEASLSAFFYWHSWLYLFLIPAVSMRLWSEERKSGTIELLLTLPITAFEAVVGKFLAAWCFIAITLFFTFPMFLTVNYLGNPDNGIIILGYLGSLIMAASFLAIGSCISSLTKNQVVAFVVSVAVCFVFVVSGYPLVLDFFKSLGLPQFMIDTIGAFSFVANFDEILKGVLSFKNIVYFASLIVFWLFVNVLVVEEKR